MRDNRRLLRNAISRNLRHGSAPMRRISATKDNRGAEVQARSPPIEKSKPGGEALYPTLSRGFPRDVFQDEDRIWTGQVLLTNHFVFQRSLLFCLIFYPMLSLLSRVLLPTSSCRRLSLLRLSFRYCFYSTNFIATRIRIVINWRVALYCFFNKTHRSTVYSRSILLGR